VEETPALASADAGGRELRRAELAQCMRRGRFFKWATARSTRYVDSDRDGDIGIGAADHHILGYRRLTRVIRGKSQFDRTEIVGGHHEAGGSGCRTPPA